MITELLPHNRRLDGAEELEEFYRPPRASHLRVNFISSLDGAVEIDGRSGPLGGPADRAAFMAMRGLSDVILVGAGTARAEDYGPVRLREDVQGRRLARGQAPLPPLAVVTARGDLQPSARLFASGGQVIVVTSESVAKSRPDLEAVSEILTCGTASVDMVSAVTQLRKRGLGRILCEGGPELARALVIAGLLDELCLTIAPLLAGAGRRLVGSAELAAAGRFELLGLLEAEGMLLARYGTRRTA